MDLIKLKNLLIEQKIFISEKPKTFLCKCYLCGDHPDPKKWGHLWVSKNPVIPVAHCFYCDAAFPISKLISDLSGNKELYKKIFTEEELENQNNQKEKSIKVSKERYKKFILPKIDIDSFQMKRLYLRSRTNNLIDVENIPNLIVDFQAFFKLNNLDIVGKDKLINDYEFDILQDSFIGFLGKHNTILFCRNCNPNASFKFKKIQLQSDQLSLIEYYSPCESTNNNSIVVLSEGSFNIISEFLTDSLKIKNNVKVYASCNGFNYSTVLKSICFDENLYKVDVVILGDRDKSKYMYNKFLKINQHVINSCKIFLNRSGKDFNIFPLVPFELV